MNKVALIIIYNHQYNKNIEILERLYSGRFSNIYHLVPFYNGDKPNVIAVYDCSYYFQGYVSQGFKSFFNDAYQHYFFVADDMILNPVINESNYGEKLKLNPKTSFIPDFMTLHESGNWPRICEAFHWDIKVNGVEAQNQLPDYNAALKSFEKFGLEIKPLHFDQIFNKKKLYKNLKLKNFTDYFSHQFRRFTNKNKEYNLSYPLVGSYSDIFVVSSDAIKEFCHYCGVFSATNLFVEVALPTSLVLASEEIVTEKDLDFEGKALWTKEDLRELDKYENSLNKLLKEFPSSYLYLHPIKLSKWKTKA
tara:strand:- start:65109 stop:66029 length:921 start_codon:yes stop_codon:yes gene_type:complete